MNTLLIYAHLAVLFLVGALFCNMEMTSAKVFGVLNAVFAIAYAYGYAIYNLWMVFRG